MPATARRAPIVLARRSSIAPIPRASSHAPIPPSSGRQRVTSGPASTRRARHLWKHWCRSKGSGFSIMEQRIRGSESPCGTRTTSKLSRKIQGLQVVSGEVRRHGEDDLAVRLPLSAVQHRDHLSIVIEDGTPIFDHDGKVIAVLYGGERESNGKIIFAVPAYLAADYLKTLNLPR